MAGKKHSEMTGAAGEGIHVSHQFTFADATARNAAVVVAADVGKIAKQTDTLTWYVLVDTTPTWKEITPGALAAHAASHENAGSDEISVAGLSGLLADDQNPTAHAVDHENGGSDEISVAGLSGLLADDQNAVAEDGIDTSAIHDDTPGEIAAVALKGTPVSGDLLLIEDSAAANAKKRITIGSLPGGGASARDAFSGYHTTPIALTETYQDLTIGTELAKTANFTHAASSAEVTANFTGTIEISGHLTGEIDVASQDRVSLCMRLMVDTGAGFVLVTGSEISGYARDNLAQTNNLYTVSMTTLILAVTSGDKFKLQVKMDDGTNNGGDADTAADMCVFTLRSL